MFLDAVRTIADTFRIVVTLAGDGTVGGCNVRSDRHSVQPTPRVLADQSQPGALQHTPTHTN